MGFITGYKALHDVVERAAEGSGDRKKVPFVGLKAGESVRVRFLQEFDPDSPSYNPDNGLCGVMVEHSSPVDFKRKAACSMEDEGACVGCEQYAAGEKGFRPKYRFYANVAVISPKGDVENGVISQGTSGKSIYPALVQFYEDNGSITDFTFTISRQGAELNNTSYTLLPMMKTVEIDIDKVRGGILDIAREVVINVPYERQRSFYKVDEVEEVDPVATQTEDIVW